MSFFIHGARSIFFFFSESVFASWDTYGAPQATTLGRKNGAPPPWHPHRRDTVPFFDWTYATIEVLYSFLAADTFSEWRGGRLLHPEPLKFHLIFFKYFSSFT